MRFSVSDQKIKGKGCAVLLNGLKSFSLFDNPFKKNLSQVVNFSGGKRPIFRNAIPFTKAGTTANGCRMLSLENRMPSKWSLLAIFQRKSRCKSFQNEVPGMSADYFEPNFLNVRKIFGIKFKSGTKGGFPKKFFSL